MALTTFLDGPYAFSLWFKRTRPLSCADSARPDPVAFERPVSGLGTATLVAALATSEPRKPLRDVIISFLGGRSDYCLVSVPVPSSVSHPPVALPFRM